MAASPLVCPVCAAPSANVTKFHVHAATHLPTHANALLRFGVCLPHRTVGPCLQCAKTTTGCPISLLPSLSIARPALLRHASAPRKRMFAAAAAAARHALAANPDCPTALAAVLSAPIRWLAVGPPPQRQPSDSISFRTAPPPLSTPLALVLRGKLSSALSAALAPTTTGPAPTAADLATLFPDPPTTETATLQLLAAQLPPCTPVTTDEVCGAVAGLKKRKAPGPFGSFNEHEALVPPASTAALLNAYLTHGAPLPALLLRSWGTLLPKPQGGFRPIAVGEPIARVTGRVLAARLTNPALVNFLRRFGQLGPTRHGAALLANLAGLTPTFGADITNAFNMVHRSFMLRAVTALAPEAARLTALLYLTPSNIDFGSHDLAPLRGVRQGCPAAAPLFALTVTYALSLAPHVR